MGVDTRAVIVVGYTYDEICEVYYKWEESIEVVDGYFYAWCEDNDLEIISPYYEAIKEDCLYGHVLDRSKNNTPFKLIINCNSEDICKDYGKNYGVKANLYLSTNVCYE